MRILKIRKLSWVNKMTAHPFYPEAKKGCLDHSVNLIDQIQPEVKLKRPAIICPVLKTAGNRIPLAMAMKISKENISSVFTDDIVLHNKRSPSTMGERFYSTPEFRGRVLNANYCLVDDVYTTGKTLITLKNYIEDNGGNVTDIICFASSKATGFELSRLDVKFLIAKFPEIEKYFDIKLITKPILRFILQHNSLQSLHTNINQTIYAGFHTGM